MGVARTDEWLLPPDAYTVDELALRARLLDEHHDDVFAALPGTEQAGSEVLAFILDALGPARRGSVRREWHGLEAAGRLVQEDLCLLRPSHEHGGRLVLAAACLCFPSHWRLAEKLGRPIVEVHGPVARYEDELAARVAGFLDRLRPGTIVARRNWSIHELPDLYSPMCPPPQGVPPAEQWLRSERQTLRRLPDTGAVLFTIRVQQCQLASLPTDVAGNLADRLEAEPDDITEYKNMQARKRAVVAFLKDHART